VRVEWRILGTFEGRCGQQVVDLGHARQLSVLAVLLMEPGRPVTIDRLVSRVWGESRPRSAARTLYGYVSRLRRILDEFDNARIVRLAGRYMLEIDPAAVDLYQFRDLVAKARASADETEAAALFGAALRLWRGEAFEALSSPWLDQVRDELDRERLAAELDHADVLLRCGRYVEVLGSAVARAAARPLDERVTGQLMRALHAAGRTAEALSTYDRMRARLAEELGIDPGGPIQELRGELLDPVPAAVRVPRQLPRRPWPFTGRQAELEQLGDPASGEGALWVLEGTGGVGKTWLALDWAHANTAAFPDGQVYIDIGGFGPTAAAVDTGDALRSFLDAFGVPADQIPDRLDALIARYRSITADKRILVVLDNARDVTQVRPLLPGSAQSTVIVTSRNRLIGLATADGARTLSLDLFSLPEAREMLAVRLGRHRFDATPSAVDDIITLCERLPLALAIVSARAAISPDVAAAGIAARLRATGTGLDRFATDDLGTDLRTVLSWSYQALDGSAADMFRLLGLFPCRDISTAAAASLAGVPIPVAQEWLERLAGAHLLTLRTDNRFVMHDLVHAYAAEQAGHGKGPHDRDVAIARILDHYLHTAHTAAVLIAPHRQPIQLPLPGPDVHPEPLTDRLVAQQWFTTELPALRGLFDLAAGSGLDTHTWQLAWTISTHLTRTGIAPHQQHQLHRTALAAATRLGDLAGQGNTLRSLGKVCIRLNRLDESSEHYRRAAEIFAVLADPVSEGHAHMGHAVVAEEQGDWDAMLSRIQHALRLYRTAGHEGFIAVGLNNLGWTYVRLKEYERALPLCTEGLQTAQRLGDLQAQADAFDSLGSAHAGLGHDQTAVECLQHALDLYIQIDDWDSRTYIETRLGDHHHQAGRHEAAQIHWQRALTILDQLDHHRAAELRQHIANITSSTALEPSTAGP